MAKHKPEDALDLYKLMEADAGMGTSDAVEDCAYWLGDITYEESPWLAALEAVDKRGDKTKLIALLQKLPERYFHWLADLLMRYQLKKKRGRQHTPIYDRSDSERIIPLAIEQVRSLKRRLKLRGTSVDTAIEQVAAAHRLNPETLRNAVMGQRGSSRRSKNKSG